MPRGVVYGQAAAALAKNPALTFALFFSNTRLSRVRVGSLRGTVLLNP
jgi:hypothetical protein